MKVLISLCLLMLVTSGLAVPSMPSSGNMMGKMSKGKLVVMNNCGNDAKTLCPNVDVMDPVAIIGCLVDNLSMISNQNCAGDVAEALDEHGVFYCATYITKACSLVANDTTIMNPVGAKLIQGVRYILASGMMNLTWNCEAFIRARTYSFSCKGDESSWCGNKTAMDTVQCMRGSSSKLNSTCKSRIVFLPPVDNTNSISVQASKELSAGVYYGIDDYEDLPALFVPPPNVGAIVGGVIGGLAGLIVLCCCCRRHRRRWHNMNGQCHHDCKSGNCKACNGNATPAGQTGAELQYGQS